ncbi:MAG TPA: SUMF1/EgtB/PvdO family nonheme iron enzyme [Gemmatimonadales bacterium]
MPAAALTATLSRRDLAELLAEARSRTVLLVSPLSDAELFLQPDNSVRSVMEELDEIIRFEGRWLGSDSPEEAGSQSYDEWFDRMVELRQQALDRLDAMEGQRARLVLEHEYRRGEAILETLQLLGETYRAPRRTRLPRGRRLADPGAMTRFPGGTVELGAQPETPVWPDEQPARRLEVEPFWMDVLPVTNGEYATFMAAGGYMESGLWSDAGWKWVRGTEARMPAVWIWEEGAWWCRWMDRMAPLDLNCPVGPVSYYEAEAFARFVGKRLPTEAEWEVAASWDPEFQSRRAYPWGNMPPSPNVANLDQLAFEPAAVGAFPGNISALGCYGLIGDLWEWTASAFDRAGFKVLKGGSWASRPGAIRTTIRKAADPGARHCFSGFRCAHDA